MIKFNFVLIRSSWVITEGTIALIISAVSSLIIIELNLLDTSLIEIFGLTFLYTISLMMLAILMSPFFKKEKVILKFLTNNQN